jgi:hypothetical protein
LLQAASFSLFGVQKIVRLNVGLAQNGPQRTFRHIAGMVGDGGVAGGILIVPDLMASGRLAVEGKAERLEAFNDLSIGKTGEPSHIRR